MLINYFIFSDLIFSNATAVSAEMTKYLQYHYRIIPNRGAVRQGNGLEIHNLQTELILNQSSIIISSRDIEV